MQLDRSRRFYIVWSQSGPNAPPHRWVEREQAVSEAGRMARENPGKEYYIALVTGKVLAPETIYKALNGETSTSA